MFQFYLRRISLVLLVLQFLVTDVNSSVLDSLKNELRYAKDQEKALSVLKKLSWEYVYINPDSAILFCDKGLILSKSNGFRKISADFLSNKSEAFRSLGQYNEAISFQLEALNIFKEYNDGGGETKCLNRIGAIYLDLNQFETALDYFFKALVKSESQRNLNTTSATLNNIGAAYFYMDDLEKAYSFFKRSMIIEENLENEIGLAESYQNVGAVLFSMGKLSESEQFFNKSLTKYRLLGDDSGIGNALNNIGNIAIEKKRYDDAVEFFVQSYEIAHKIKNKEDIKSSGQNLAKALSMAGRNKEAYELVTELTILRDSILNEENQRSIAEMATKYKVAEKEKENRILLQNAEIQELELENKQTMVYGVTAALVLSLGVVFLGFFAYRQKTRSNILLRKQRDTIAEQKKDLTDSIAYAKHLQDAVLSDKSILNYHFHKNFIFFQPKDIVSGDFFWFQKVDDFLFVAVADCTGHGVPGAMVSIVCINALNRSVLEFNIHDPGDILDNCALLIEKTFSAKNNINDGMDISLLRINLSDLSASWAGANNPLWIIRNDMPNEIQVIKPDHRGIGSTLFRKSFTTHSFKLMKNDELFLFSDGYVDQFGGDSFKKLKSRNFKKLLIQSQPIEMESKGEFLKEFFNNWKGDHEQIDDVCVLGLKI